MSDFTSCQILPNVRFHPISDPVARKKKLQQVQTQTQVLGQNIPSLSLHCAHTVLAMFFLHVFPQLLPWTLFSHKFHANSLCVTSRSFQLIGPTLAHLSHQQIGIFVFTIFSFLLFCSTHIITCQCDANSSCVKILVNWPHV